MKFNLSRVLLFASIVFLMSSCLGTTDTTTLSTNASFSSFTITGNDSVKAAAFTLELLPGYSDSVIVNLDSMYYKTPISAVYPAFTFKSSAAQHMICGKDSVTLDGTDTIDFRKSWSVRNYASDGTKTRLYQVKVNVHQVQPELYVWTKIVDNMDCFNATGQKAITLNNTVCYFINNSTSTYLYTSTDGYNWSSAQTVSGLPTNISLSDMVAFNGKLYLSQGDNNLYSSVNGTVWTKSAVNYTLQSLLFVLNNQLWALVTDNSNSYFATYDGTNASLLNKVTNIDVPDNFPSKNFTSLSFASRSGVPKVIVIGGVSKNNVTLKNRWSMELGSDWVDFSPENHTLDTMALGSVILYDDKLLAYGSRKDNQKPYLLESKDQGLSWKRPDSIKNYLQIPIHSISAKTQKDTIASCYNYEPHQLMSAVVINPKTYAAINDASLANEIKLSNRIFLMGVMQGTSGLKADIWTEKLNRKNFLRQ